jgi:tetratricopeptide (TPR) repeat protein
MEETTFRAGTTIVAQGDQGDAFYLIQAGTVQVVVDSGTGNSEIIAILGPKDWIGEMALLSGEPRSATIITLTDAILWRLRREDWDDLVEKHPTWLRQFCATLSKRLSRLDRQYSTGREAFKSLAEEFYSSRSAREQEFLRRASLIDTFHKNTFTELFRSDEFGKLLFDLGDSQFPLIRTLADGKYALHDFFQDFLREKLLTVDGAAAKQQYHEEFAARYEAMGDWQQTIHHAVESQNWPGAVRLLASQGEKLLAEAPLFVKNTIESFPQEEFLSKPQLVNLKGAALIQLGDLPGAYRAYHEVLAHKARGAFSSDTLAGYRRMAETLARAKEYGQAIHHLRSALNVIEQEAAASDNYPDFLQATMSTAVAHPLTSAAWPGHALRSYGCCR